ncbi:MAG: hypothetical protein Q7S55_01090 [Nanoarchaeota archaeon]|nr:hypothetical protein [Nanoarchaeota archaeon]
MSKSTTKKISFKGQAKCKKLEVFFPEDISPLDEKSNHSVPFQKNAPNNGEVGDVPSGTKEE